MVLEPAFAAAHFGLANTCKDLDAMEEALTHYRRAAEIEPENPDYLMNLGAAHRELEDLEAALAATEAAIASAPDHRAAAWNRAQILLMMGRFDDGWAAYGARFNTGPQAFRYRFPNIPEWDGSNIRDGKLLLWGDQGLGDELIVGSLIVEAAMRAPDIILECEPRLAPLFKRSFPDFRVVPRSNPPDDRTGDSTIRAQMAWGDLGRIFRQRADRFAPSRGYLKADEGRVQGLRARYAQLGSSLRIGISWESANPHYKDKVDIPLAAWQPVLSLADIVFVSVQYGDQREAIRQIRARTGAQIFVDDTVDQWNDVDGWAAQIRAMDAVISASNSAACLAGALGVPGWQLVPTAPEFYWGMTNETCMWFEPMRIVHQTHRGDWADVMPRLADQVRNYARP